MEHIIANLLQDFEQGKMSRRQLIQGLAMAATAASAVGMAPSAFAASPIKAVGVHHITWDVKDHNKCVNFYSDLFGMKLFKGTMAAKEAHVQCGVTYLTFRGPGARETAPPTTPYVDHIAVGVEPFPGPNMDDVSGSPVVVAELKKRGFQLKDKGEIRIKDPEGFPVQICGMNWHTEN